MPSRVRVAAVIGGRAYFGGQIINYLQNVADRAGVLISNRKKGAAWKDVLAAWEVGSKYLDGCKLFVIRERRGLKASRSLFNQKLLGYRRKKKVARVLMEQQIEVDWAEAANPNVPPPARRPLIGVNEAGILVYEPRNAN